MNELFDPNNIATEFFLRNSTKILEFGRSIISDAKANIDLRIRAAYVKYIESAEDRYGKAKSFFFRSTPTDIYEFYVPLGVVSGHERLDRVSLDSIINLSRRVVVSAPAGSGKSMLLRHFLLDALRYSDRIPIFVELRNLNNSSNSILEAARQSLKDFGFNLGEEYVQKAMKLGHFVLLLDGFDEVDYKSRNLISRQIVDLGKSYGDCVFIVSSRPDDTFSGWNDFTELNIAPLSVNDACELVEKLPVDTKIRAKFLDDLRKFLFVRHESFLSNPLLLSIMLLTYGENANIPQKLSLFYSQAYVALYNRHDALKGGYQRERKTTLDIQDFELVFAAFCLQTYDQRKFSFSRSDALECIRKARAFVSMELSEEDFLHDCLQSVNLLTEDGLNLVFSHRSFQEYFVARHIHLADPQAQIKLLDRFLPFVRRDSVFGLLFEINPRLIERELLIPNLSSIFDQIGVKRKIGITHFTRLLKENCSEVLVGKKGIFFKYKITRQRDPLTIDIMSFACDCCVPESSLAFDNDKYEGFIEKFGGEEEMTFSTSELSIRSPVLKELAEIFGFMSIDWLEKIYQSYLKLSREHESAPKSLENLLN